MKKPDIGFNREALVKWIDNDPFREAILISKVPVKASTLGRIKSGSYVPSDRLARAILSVMNSEK